MNRFSVILDTNVIIYFLYSKKLELLLRLIILNDLILSLSNELFIEYIEVISNNKFKDRFSEQDKSTLLSILKIYGYKYDVHSNTKICRDEDDNKLINLALDSNADFLITGDKDLLVIQMIGKTVILKWRNFLHVLTFY